MTNSRYNLRRTRNRLLRSYRSNNRNRNLNDEERQAKIAERINRWENIRATQLQTRWRNNHLRNFTRYRIAPDSFITRRRLNLPVRGDAANIRDGNDVDIDIRRNIPPPYHGHVEDLPTYEEAVQNDNVELPAYDHTLRQYGGLYNVNRRRLREFLPPEETIGLDNVQDDRRRARVLDVERWVERRENAASRIQRAFRRHRFRRDVQNFFDDLHQPEEFDFEINSILVNEREVPFDIYRFKGRNGECRNNFVLYWNKEDGQIGVKWIDGDYMTRPLPFIPDFTKRKIFFLDILQPNFLNEFRIDVRNTLRRSLGSFYYTRQDIINKNDKFITVPDI